MIKAKFNIGDLVTFTHIIFTKRVICSRCEGAGGFEDDTHYGGYSRVGCSGCNGRGSWYTNIIPYKKKEGPFQITQIKVAKDSIKYMLNQTVLRDWKYDPVWFAEKDLKKFNGKSR